MLVLPLRLDEKTIGVIRVYAGDYREFDDQEIRFLESAANLSAIAIENATLHQKLQADFDVVLEYMFRLDDN